jgi:3'-5' exoribonuclease
MHEVYAKASPEKAAIYDQQMRDVELLEHIIASHHTELEWGSPVNPVTLEAMIVCHADQLSASTDTITTALKESTEPWTQKIFTQHNRQFTTSGVNDLG